MKAALGIAILFALAACGPSEREVAAEERARHLEQELSRFEGMADEQTVAASENGALGNSPVETSEESDADTSSSVLQSGRTDPQGPVASYTAYIGQEDLYNSEGQRLDLPWQILRQDRANYHRFGISQPGDQGDPFFSSANNRAIMERLVATGSINRSAGRRIVEGEVRVVVEIFGNSNGLALVNVTVN